MIWEDEKIKLEIKEAFCDERLFLYKDDYMSFKPRSDKHFL